MAVAVPESERSRDGLGARSGSFGAIARLLGGICAIESVRKVKLSTEGEQVDLWVLVGEENWEDESRIWRLERSYRAAVAPPAFELHFVPLSEIDEAVLPPAETIFER
jgi:hypothetical protein